MPEFSALLLELRIILKTTGLIAAGAVRTCTGRKDIWDPFQESAGHRGAGISERKREATFKQCSASGEALFCTQKGGGRDFNPDTLTPSQGPRQSFWQPIELRLFIHYREPRCLCPRACLQMLEHGFCDVAIIHFLVGSIPYLNSAFQIHKCVKEECRGSLRNPKWKYMG